MQALDQKDRCNNNCTSTGLKQSMLNLITTFSPTKLQCSEGFRESPRSIKAAKYFIFTTIRSGSMHEDTLNRIVDEGQLDDHFRMPTFEVIPPEKMEVHLGAIFKDEGIIAGTQEVHNEIFLNKLRMVKDPATTGDPSSPNLPAESADEFQTRLFIVHGPRPCSQVLVYTSSNIRLDESSAQKAYCHSTALADQLNGSSMTGATDDLHPNI